MTENRSGDAVGPGASPPHASPQPQLRPTSQPPSLDELFAAATRPAPVAPDAEAKALAAFRAARDEGALELPTRPEDDWWPAKKRTRAPWAKAGLGTLVAGVMFGGVAMAAGGIPTPFDGPPSEKPAPAPSASPSVPDGGSAGTTSPATGSAGHPDTDPATGRPPTAEDRAAHCRAYAAGRKSEGKGKAMDSAVRERLEAAAGGPDAVEAYCAPLLTARPAATSDGGHPSKPGRDPDAPPADAPPADAGKGGRDNGRFPSHQ
ncbi:hypothetical protein [Streptomyces pristinaespiralis]|uniref:hypothetical protein n=1 Tax=Streptomyces pristinaespiralis TaxID=38300 RepID=UPI0033E13771